MTGGAVFLFGGALRLKARVPDLISEQSEQIDVIIAG